FGASFAPAYAASKGGIVQLTKSMATAWAADNIQVNAVLPGWIETDLTAAAKREVPGLNENVLRRTPAQRWGTIDDMAGIAVFLASAASDFVTGAAIAVAGGYSIQGCPAHGPRRIPDAHARLKALEWDRSIYGAELHRKTLGVVGLGKVGLRVAARLRGFEPARLLVYDPYIPEARARDVGARLVPDFDALLREADVVTFHVPLTPETEGMAGARELALLRPGARVVNCARGGIVVEADLLAALESGHVAGAAIDVWSEEPPRSETLRRLIAHPRVVVTPHLGANSAEAQVNVAVDVARQLVAFRDGALVEHAVNIPVADATTVEELRPFVALAEVLGRFCVQLDPEHLARVEVTVAGAIAETDPELLARGVLAGLLDPVTAGPVNLVNAHLVARERGVEVEIHRTE